MEQDHQQSPFSSFANFQPHSLGRKEPALAIPSTFIVSPAASCLPGAWLTTNI